MEYFMAGGVCIYYAERDDGERQTRIYDENKAGDKACMMAI